MRWFFPIYLFYSFVRSYVENIYSLLNHVIIPHKAFIDNTEREYEFEMFSQEQKRVSFSDVEKEILLQLIENEKDAIDITTLDANSLYRKRQAWERISKEFNSYEETSKRTVYQLRNWWTIHKNQTPKVQWKQITYEQIGDGLANNIRSCDAPESREIALIDARIENVLEKSNGSSVVDKSIKYGANVDEKQLRGLQLREIQKRYQVIEEESQIKLNILKLQLKQEQLKTMQAERELEVQKQKDAILDLDIRQKQMDIEMREHSIREKQMKVSSKNNKRTTS